MMEDEISIFCLQRDKVLIQEILEEATKEFEELTEKVLGKKKTVKISIEQNKYLEERKIPNLNDIPLSEITKRHEESIKISQEVDDQFW